jgi:hypothetical protein
MAQDRINHVSGNGVAEQNERRTSPLRDLTYDEKKAAEAAFQGEPFNPAWSAAAAVVYEGIVSAMSRMQVAALTDLDVVEAAEECLTR